MEFKKHYRVELAETLSGHWYKVWEGENYVGVFPSATTILNAYPQSLQLMKWLADNGWNQSQLIKSMAGESGTRIHTACDILEDGGTLRRQNYSLEEWVKICSFVSFYHEYHPTLIAKELAVFNEAAGYAGRLDRLYDIHGEITLLDFKSGGVYPHFPLQYACYAKAVEKITDLKIDQTATLKLGATNKAGFNFIIYPDWKEHYRVFEHVQAVWKYDFFESKKNKKDPPVLEVPDELNLKVNPYENRDVATQGKASVRTLSLHGSRKKNDKGDKRKKVQNRPVRQSSVARKKKSSGRKGAQPVPRRIRTAGTKKNRAGKGSSRKSSKR